MKDPQSAFRDPFLSQLCAAVEQALWSADKEAQAAGLLFTDSAIKSSLIKAMNSLRGKHPKNPASSPKDQFLERITAAVLSLRHQIRGAIGPDEAGADASPGTEPSNAVNASTEQWLSVLNAVIHSIEIRMSGAAGGRDYLEFLPEFFKGIESPLTLDAILGPAVPA